jgi:hypothetical protein
MYLIYFVKVTFQPIKMVFVVRVRLVDNGSQKNSRRPKTKLKMVFKKWPMMNHEQIVKKLLQKNNCQKKEI